MLARRALQRLASCHRVVSWTAPVCHFASTQTQHKVLEPGLSLHYQDKVAIIQMDNGRDNRINSLWVKELESMIDAVKGNNACKGLITTGEGRFYCNGLDIEWMKTLTAEELIKFMKHWQSVLVKLLLFPMPTMAVINGHAFGGGAVVAFTHDLLTMNSDKGWLCFNEVHLSKRVGQFMKDYLRIKLGGGRNVSDALILGRRYTAEQAYKNHLLHAAHPKLSLLDHSLQILHAYIGRNGLPRSGIENMKKDIYKIPLETYEKESKEREPYTAVQFMTHDQLTALKKH